MDCDRGSALTMLHQLQIYTGQLLGSQEPNIYVLELLPELAAATAALLMAAGLVKTPGAARPGLESSRVRLLGCFDSLIDEVENCKRKSGIPKISPEVSGKPVRQIYPPERSGDFSTRLLQDSPVA